MNKYKIIVFFFSLIFCFNLNVAMEKNMQIENLNNQQEKIFKFKEQEKELLEKCIKKENFENDISTMENEINSKLKQQNNNCIYTTICCYYKKNIKYKNISKIIVETVFNLKEKTVENVNIKLIFKNYHFLKEKKQIQNVEFKFSKCEKALLEQYIEKENFENNIKELEDKINSLLKNSFDTNYISYFKNLNNNLLSLAFRVNSSFNLNDYNPLNLNENKNCFYVAINTIITIICYTFNHFN